MTKDKAKKRIQELNRQITYHAKKYYDEDSSEISDFEYDMLTLELKELAANFPGLLEEELQIEKIGGTIKEGFGKITHEVPLQSLQDVFSKEEIYTFDERIKKLVGNVALVVPPSKTAPLQYVVETKIDGLSVSL